MNEDLRLGSVSEQLFTRSPLVQMADQILLESGKRPECPRCLAEAFILPDEVQKYEGLLRQWPTLSRIADYEDRYLKQEVYTRPRILCGVLPCTSERKKRFTNNQEDEDLAATSQLIKKQNESIMEAISAFKKNKRQSQVSLHLTKLSFFKQLLIAISITRLPVESTTEDQPNSSESRFN